MEEIIILSESEDEADQKVTAASQAKALKVTVTPKSSACSHSELNQCIEVVELLSDDSDSDKPKKTAKSLATTGDDSDFDSDGSMLRSKSVFKRKRPSSLPAKSAAFTRNVQCYDGTWSVQSASLSIPSPSPCYESSTNPNRSSIRGRHERKRHITNEFHEENNNDFATTSRTALMTTCTRKENGAIEIIDICDDESETILNISSDEIVEESLVIIKRKSLGVGGSNKDDGLLYMSDDDSIFDNKSIGLTKSKQESSIENDEDCVVLRNENNTFTTSANHHEKHDRSVLSQSSNSSATLEIPHMNSAVFSYSPQPPTEHKLFTYPTLLANSKSYEDQRARYMLAFWRYARRRVQNSYDRGKLDQISKKIVYLALFSHPIRSLEEYCFSRGVGGGGASAVDRNIRDGIRLQLEEGGLDHIRTPVGATSDNMYYSITEACLVAMISQAEQQLLERGILPLDLANMANESVKHALGEKDMWISLEFLIPAIDNLLKPECPARLSMPEKDDFGASYFTESSTRSAEFLQIAKLEASTRLSDSDSICIKRHRLRGKLMYELTVFGYKSATMIRDRQFPACAGHYRRSRIDTISQVEIKYKGICLGIDLREGGGGTKGLHEMCNKLDTMKVPFLVGSLTIGDYAFFTHKTGSDDSDNLNYLCPILIERKSIQDIAQSIHDGRWKSQKRRMYVGQYVFGYDNSKMVFIIEGKEETQQVSGGYIGHRRFNVDMDRLTDEIENLKSEGFEVIRTSSLNRTMFEVSRWAQRVAEQTRTGKLAAKYTYVEFKDKVKMIPAETDFSRLAKYAMSTRMEHTLDATSTPKSPRNEPCAADSDSDIEVLDLFDPSPANKTSEPRSAMTSSNQDENIGASKPSKDTNLVDYSCMSVTKLQSMCKDAGLVKSGSKAALVERLNGPHPPKILLKRKKEGEYVPERHNVAGTALLVALYLHEKDLDENDKGLTKEELYVKTESLEITKNPFSGGTTQTGPFLYDGWSSMAKLLIGDPALVIKKKNRYKLTRSSAIAGYSVSKAMHKWCHEHGNCPCSATEFD